VLAGVGVKMKAAAKEATTVRIIMTAAAAVPVEKKVPDKNLFRILAPALWNSMH
jgi:hypothetical protein